MDLRVASRVFASIHSFKSHLFCKFPARCDCVDRCDCLDVDYT